MKKKVSATVSEYRKVRKRVLSNIRRMEKRGYIFDSTLVPRVPQKITKASVRRLQKLTSEELYRVSKYVDRETGEILTGQEGRKLRRSLASKRSAEKRRLRALEIEEAQKRYTAMAEEYGMPDYVLEKGLDRVRGVAREVDFVINAFLERVSDFNPRFNAIMRSWIDKIIHDNGKWATAKMMMDAQNQGLVFDYAIAYDDDKRRQYLADIISFLPDQGDLYRDQLIDEMERSESWEGYDY